MAERGRGIEKDVIDQEDEETFKARQGGIPLEFAGQKRNLVKSDLTADEVKLFSEGRVRTCGGCRCFSRRHFAGKEDKFVAELIHDMEWRTEFLGDDPKNMGVCTAKDNVVTGPNSLACSSYRGK